MENFLEIFIICLVVNITLLGAYEAGKKLASLLINMINK